MTQSKKKNGRIYLSVAESYRENGKTKTRSVRSLGYVDELEKEHGDPIAYWKQWCRDETAAAKAARDERFAPVGIGIRPAQKIDKRAVGRKNIGSAALMAVYNAMGLLQDKNAVPITYEVFPGNTNDCETMTDILADMKRDYALDRVVMVADKGNNTSTDIAACAGRGDGFVVSQSVRGAKSNRELREWAISGEGYRERGESGGFKVKSRQDTKVITVEGPDGKPRKVPVEVKTVAFWSRKYQQRARREREETLRKAAELVRNPGLHSAAAHYGAARYVKGLSVDRSTGEILEPKSVLAFDRERLASDEACDGYYCLTTSEYKLPDEEVIDICKGLWRIEESFKVTKSDLETRPAYCSTPEHIKAHFLTCYITLCILRILQLKANNAYSAGTVAGELAKMCGTNADANWRLFDHRSDASDAICDTLLIRQGG